MPIDIDTVILSFNIIFVYSTPNNPKMSVISNSDAFPDESPWKKLYQMFMKFISTSIFEKEYWDEKND